MKLSVVIPAHNEEQAIMKTVDDIVFELKRENIEHEVILVNDNSLDATLEKMDVLRKRYPENMVLVNRMSPAGFGLAIRDGLAKVSGDAVVMVMADSSDDPRDIVKYFRKIEDGYDCVFGSRFVKSSVISDYPLLKLILNRMGNLFIQVILLIKFNDITNAFKIYRTDVIRSCLPLESCDFNITVELPLKAYRRRFKIIQIPINWKGRKTGLSKLKIKEVSFEYLKTIFRVFLEPII